MSWIRKSKERLQVAALLLLLAAFIGPWFFERLAIPAPHACPGPNVRLSEHMCGTPMSGVQVIYLMLSGIVAFVVGIINGTLDLTVQKRELLTMPLFLFGIISIILPVFILLKTIIQRGAQKRGVFHILALGIALFASLFWVVIQPVSWRHYWYLWGSWLYISMIIYTLIMELLTRSEVGRNTTSG